MSLGSLDVVPSGPDAAIETGGVGIFSMRETGAIKPLPGGAIGALVVVTSAMLGTDPSTSRPDRLSEVGAFIFRS